MARPLRIEYEGALYHVTTRGNAGHDVFRDDEDRKIFLATLAEVIETMGWHCYAYCLMHNHYHLVIETPAANLGRGMRQLNGIYTQAINRRYGHGGASVSGTLQGDHRRGRAFPARARRPCAA